MITKVRACWGRTQQRYETLRRAARRAVFSAQRDTVAASVFFSHTVGVSVLARRTHISHLCIIPTHLPHLCREENTLAASVSSWHTVGPSVSSHPHALAASRPRKSRPRTPDRPLPASYASLACTREPFFPSSSGHLPPQAPREDAVASPRGRSVEDPTCPPQQSQGRAAPC